MCPLCTNEDDVVLIDLGDDRKRVECRSCDYAWDVSVSEREMLTRRPIALSGNPSIRSRGGERYARVVGPVDGRGSDGTEIRLDLKLRTSLSLGKSWHTITWRTRYEPGGQNRRFYSSGGQLWAMPAREALRMLEELQRRGGLDEAYQELPRARQRVCRSSELVPDERRRRFEEITLAGETWSRDARFVFTEGGEWRKILVVEPDADLATFRSTTTDRSYGMRKILRDGLDWVLDNAMQDADPWEGRLFLDELRAIYPAGAG